MSSTFTATIHINEERGTTAFESEYESGLTGAEREDECYEIPMDNDQG